MIQPHNSVLPVAKGLKAYQWYFHVDFLCPWAQPLYTAMSKSAGFYINSSQRRIDCVTLLRLVTEWSEHAIDITILSLY